MRGGRSRGSDPGAYVQAWVWVSLDEKYPKEDKCTYCGEHIGWILSEVGAFLSLGVCGKHGCQEQYNEDHEVDP